MSKTHKVRKHIWNNGVLNTVEHVFEDLESAINFCNSKRNHKGTHALKVITPDGEVAHSVTPGGVSESYA